MGKVKGAAVNNYRINIPGVSVPEIEKMVYFFGKLFVLLSTFA